MYGTVARLKVKPGMLEQLKQLTRAEDMMGIPGMKSTTVYQMDADANELYLIVAFESKDAYVKNADSPDQDKRFREFMALLDAEPEWHDGEIIYQHTS